MKKTIMVQMIIFIVAFFSMTPDIAEDNSYLFGLIGDVTIVRGNTIWVMMIAAVLSALNIYFWWPKGVDTPSEKPVSAEGAKSAEASTEVKTEVVDDPVVPKMD